MQRQNLFTQVHGTSVHPSTLSISCAPQLRGSFHGWPWRTEIKGPCRQISALLWFPPGCHSPFACREMWVLPAALISQKEALVTMHILLVSWQIMDNFTHL